MTSAETLAENHIRQNHSWQKLPVNVKQSYGNSQREYEKAVISFSVKNQLRYKGNLVKTIRKDEPRYYEEVLQYSRDHLMLYPYHLSDIMVKGLRMTPFSYYITMMQDIMGQEKSYDSLPNFTAADCLRLLGIGRNQYIDLMNQCRSSKKFFRKRPVKELLPGQPIEVVSIEPWWVVQVGFVTDDDIKNCNDTEKKTIDVIIDVGAQVAGELDSAVVHSLYRKGLIYLEVPIGDDDCISVPPLEGFVMNRVLGDYFETLLYKIFVSIDETTPVAELASVLQIDLQLVKNAVSMYCRLGFARKKCVDVELPELHPSWNVPGSPTVTKDQKMNQERTLLIGMSSSVHLDASGMGDNSKTGQDKDSTAAMGVTTLDPSLDIASQAPGQTKRIAFLFDSTLTAFLMMGNLSPGLKSHAVTMFEVGKLSDESMDSFLGELEKVGSDAEGEARRYFDHALTLRDTVRFLRYNRELAEDGDCGQGVDLLRCESLLGLDAETRSRVLNKNYSLLVSMAPLSKEIRPVSSCVPHHIGPAIPEVSSVWFKLFVYNLTQCGPPSLLLMKGTKLRRMPSVFKLYDRLLVTTWGHDPGVIASSNILLTLNDALSHSAVFVQGHGVRAEGMTVHIPFPFDKAAGPFTDGHYQRHPTITTLQDKLDLNHTCGYVTILNPYREERQLDDEEEDIADVFSQPGHSMTNSSQSEANKDKTSPDSQEKTSDQDDPSLPRNGIRDKQSADDLEKELDSLDTPQQGKEKEKEVQEEEKEEGGGGQSKTSSSSASSSSSSCIKSKLTLDVKNSDDGNAKGAKKDGGKSTKQTSELMKEDDWLLLDLCFGLPLFNTTLNKDVCSKISKLGLFKQESLQGVVQSSRTLSLQLLEFIVTWQVPSVVNEVDCNGVPCNREEHCSLFPSQNILFDGHAVQVWKNH